jgi:hypothetical protein
MIQTQQERKSQDNSDTEKQRHFFCRHSDTDDEIQEVKHQFSTDNGKIANIKDKSRDITTDN